MSGDMLTAYVDNLCRVTKADYYSKLTVRNAVLPDPFTADRSWFGMQGCILTGGAGYPDTPPLLLAGLTPGLNPQEVHDPLQSINKLVVVNYSSPAEC